MAGKIVRSTESFDKLIKENGYYVDKTELIYELVQETGNDVTLFTRPRRFGKTLTMSMLESFFSNQSQSVDVFREWSIAKNHPEFCKEWMNQYPVLFISLKDVEGRNFDLAYAKLKTVISDLCKKISGFTELPGIDCDDLTEFSNLKAKRADEDSVQNAVKTIMRMMHAVYGKQVILLIDEYDVPLAKAHANDYYDQMLDVIRGLMSTSLKTNEYLKFAVVTGCLRIPKESIFTGVNNFVSYSVLDKKFSGSFGFTDDEVDRMLEAFGFEHSADSIREWYDGYLFGNTKIYCPWDVVNYVSALCDDANAVPMAYWEHTSGNDAIEKFFDLGNDSINEKFETLLNGGYIEEKATNALTYDTAFTSENNLWSVLLMTGYVTLAAKNGETASAANGKLDEKPALVALRIPNREIANIFKDAVSDHFKNTVDQSRINELMAAMWEKEEEKASTILSDLLFDTISFMDYHEDYYHAFVAGIFAARGYVTQSNRERGEGRSDVIIRDNRNRRIMIIETKKSETKKRMEYWCKDAIHQIKEMKYAENLDGYKDILCYGISFFKKRAMVKLKEDC